MLPSTSFHWSEVKSQGQSRFKGRGLHKAENTDRYDSMGAHLCTHGHVYQSGKARLCCSKKPLPKSHCLKTQKFRPLLSFEMAHTLWNVFLLRPLAFQDVPYSVCGMSVQFSWPHGLQHARLPCPSPTPGDCSNSDPSSCWSYPTISSSVIPFSSCLQSFPASGSFPMSQLFTSGGQSLEASASASVLPMNIQGWFPLGLTGLISSQSNRPSRVFSNTTVQKHQFFGTQLSLLSNSYIHTWLLEKP